jgi:hypothetical protein
MSLGADPKDVYLAVLNGLMVTIHFTKEGNAVSALLEEPRLGHETLE